MVEAALLRNELFVAAAFPDQVAPIRFAAYRPGMTYGWHADLAHMRFDAMIVRADALPLLVDYCHVAQFTASTSFPPNGDRDAVEAG